MSHPNPDFVVIGAGLIRQWLDENSRKVFDIASRAYLNYADGQTVCPDSYFLRFPDNDRNRIIALPASIEAEPAMAGLKWISSFPDNVAKNLDRASAVLILNDRRTGYPRACLEASLISAARTAASAAIGAHYLHPGDKHVKSLGVIGAGPIAFSTLRMLRQLGWRIDAVRIFDISNARAFAFCEKGCALVEDIRPASLPDTITGSDMILFATSAGTPYVDELEWFRHAPTVLHMSLRDLSPEIILAGQNLADDPSHAMRARTSLHMASEASGRTDFVDGGAADLIRGQVRPDPGRPRIYSPFGLGVLDLAVGTAIVSEIGHLGTPIPDFFPVPYASEQ